MTLREKNGERKATFGDFYSPLLWLFLLGVLWGGLYDYRGF